MSHGMIEGMLSKAYQEGWKAALDGEKSNANPHDNNDLWTAWSEGFHDQKEDERDWLSNSF